MRGCLGLLVLFAVDGVLSQAGDGWGAGGGFSFNPSPFWCNSVPQFAPCAQPAIPICCGPCYQAQPAPASGGPPPAGGAGAQPPPGAQNSPSIGGPPPAGGAGGPPPAGGAGGPPPAGGPGGPPPAGGAGGPPPAGGSGGPPPAGGPGGPPPAGGASPPPATEAPNAGAPPPQTPAGGASTPPPAVSAGTPPAGGVTSTPPGGASTGNCPIACPPGWNTWGPVGESCYLMPAQPLHSDTFWNQQAYCKSKEPTSNILVVDSLAEQALGTAVSLQYFPSWAAQATNIYWWLGGYTDASGKWNFVDGTDQSGSPMMLLAQIVGGKNNDTCVGADAKTLGEWQTYNCEEKTGAVICEMPKRPVCGPTGGSIPVSPVDLSPSKLKDLFPKAPSIPFISGLLGGGGGAPGGGLGGLPGLGKR